MRWLVVLAAACGGSSHAHAPIADAPPDTGSSAPTGDIVEHSGSRLVVEWWQTTDGTRQFRGLYDSQLGVDCFMYPAGDDGQPRCVGGDANVVYADAACTQPLAIAAGSGAPHVAIDIVPGVCGYFANAAWSVGAASAATSYYQTDFFGDCTGPVAATGPLYTATATTPAIFVAATVQHDPSLPLATTYLQADDGTVVPATSGFDGLAYGTTILHETAEDFDCEVDPIYAQLGNTGGVACELFTGPFGGVYADQACSVPAGGVNGCADVPPVVYDPAMASCDDHALLHLGSAATALYAADGSACAPAMGEDGVTYYAADQPFTMPALAPAFGSAAGGARLARAFVTTPDGLHQHTDLYDTQLGVECSVEVASDGVARCLPTVPVGSLFADAACSTAVAGVEIDQTGPCAGGPTPPSPGYAVSTGSAGIDAVVALAATPTAAYIRFGSACDPTPAYLAGSAVPLDAFETATAILDR